MVSRGDVPGHASKTQRAAPDQPGSEPPVQQPVALLYGPGHRIVHANPAFVAEFGAIQIGMPASEALLDLPPRVLEVVDRSMASGRPLATWIEIHGARRRLTVAPRSDPETGEIYGVAIRIGSA